jgi:hypothetical protein
MKTGQEPRGTGQEFEIAEQQEVTEAEREVAEVELEEYWKQVHLEAAWVGLWAWLEVPQAGSPQISWDQHGLVWDGY